LTISPALSGSCYVVVVVERREEQRSVTEGLVTNARMKDGI
jgi:hypothetical protein